MPTPRSARTNASRTQAHIKQLGALQIAYVRYNEKGEIVYVDDASRLKERAELETWVKAELSDVTKLRHPQALRAARRNLLPFV